MTTGSYNNNALQTVTCSYNGAPLASAVSGFIRTKSWTGGDDPVKDLSRRSYTEHVYYVRRDVRLRTGQVRTRLVKRTYRIHNRVKHDRGLHAYDAEFENGSLPVGSFQSQQVRDADGAVLNSGEFSNTPVSLFISGPQALPYPSLTAEDQWRLISKLRKQIVGNPFNLAVSLGETRETLQMIGDTARKLAMSVSLLRRGHFKAALRELEDPRAVKHGARHVANPYLQVTYGWVPLLSDIKAGAEFVSHYLNVPQRRRYSAVVHSRDNQETGLNATFGGRNWSTGGYSLKSRRVVAFISEVPGLWGTLGFSDPLSVIWELTPYSFVADWFLPFGDWLEARGSSSLLEGLFVTTDFARVRVQNPFVSIWKDAENGVTSTISGGAAGTWLGRAAVSRSISTSLDCPMPDVKSFNTDLTWRHAASGVALMVQAFSKPLGDAMRHRYQVTE